MSRFIDLSGKKFNQLTVIRIDGKDAWGKYRWLCQCACGNKTTVIATHLKNGHTKSCGCLAKHNRKTHGHLCNRKMSTTYNSWSHMIQRCTNIRNKDYDCYGGRGITVCKRWRKFENFLADMGKTPKGYQIDRIDNNIGYHKTNCRWTTAKNNCRNRRSNHTETYKGKTRTLIEWSEEFGISYNLIICRLKRGWSIQKTLTTPKIVGYS